VDERREAAYTRLLGLAQRQKAVLGELQVRYLAPGVDDVTSQPDGIEHLERLKRELLRLHRLPSQLTYSVSLVVIHGYTDAISAAYELQGALENASILASTTLIDPNDPPFDGILNDGARRMLRDVERRFNDARALVTQEVEEFALAARIDLDVPSD